MILWAHSHSEIFPELWCLPANAQDQAAHDKTKAILVIRCRQSETVDSGMWDAAKTIVGTRMQNAVSLKTVNSLVTNS